MKIDRSNYEIWFIDWLDGNLNSHQVEQLNLFLNENPDLKEEFNELAPVIIQHSDNQYKNKESLKRSASDIPDSQFEYLCVAFLENDLSSEQKTELINLIEEYPDKKRSFELIQKTRISPVPVGYKYKSSLFKRTPLQNVLRLSVPVLSAAAVIALIITIFLNPPKGTPVLIIETAEIQYPDKVILRPAGQINEVKEVPVKKEILTLTKTELTTTIPEDTIAKKAIYQSIYVDRILFTSEIIINNNIELNTLQESNIIYSMPNEDDGRSNVSRFISKTFREIILKENTATDSPLRGYEIAEAGVTGLNKLLGWEMALDKNSDENGELTSLYFSSSLLKFNSPVKKSEQ